ncbi:MAG: hypothetical protein ACRDS0_21655 [Pseudonocardiaceae bacterium]
MDIFEWAHQQDYDYVVNVETDLSFVTDGFTDLVADGMRDADYMVAKVVPTISPTSRWRPYRSLRPELSELRDILETQTFSGGFSPAQVFSWRYVQTVVESPFYCRPRRFVEQNQSPLRSFTLQEVLLPTLAGVLGQRIRDYCPEVARFNRYRPYHSAASVSAARSAGVPFVHPVRRDPTDAARQFVRTLHPDSNQRTARLIRHVVAQDDNGLRYNTAMQYYVQFAAGAGGLLLETLDHQLGGLRVRYSDDSAMILESSSDPDIVAAIPFIKNAFIVVAETGRGSLDKGVVQLSRVIANTKFPRPTGQINKFRLMVHIDGSLAPVAPRAKTALEQAIAQRTGSRVEPRGMCQEYWVVGRQGMNQLLLCARLAKARRPPKAKGAISHELSAMLIAASKPSPRDVFLDPFGGSGTFAVTRLEQPFKELWYSDLDLAQHRPTFPRQLTENKRVRLLAEDALTLPSIADGSIDVIVTDPSWGEHEMISMPYRDFAYAIGVSFARVLQPTRGRFVLVVNRRNAEVMHDGLSSAKLPPEAEHQVLVNGHPATVLIGKRKGMSAVNTSTATAQSSNTTR